MKKLINNVIDFFYFDFLKKFIPLTTFKYIVCGCTTLAVGFITYMISFYLILRGNNVVTPWFTFSPHVSSQFFSFCVSFPTGFFLNRLIVFTESELRGRVQLFRYSLSVLSSLAFSIFLIKLFVDIMKLNETIAKICTDITVTIYSYFVQQYFSFKVKNFRKTA
ncbi:MAG: GtrA family protein [Chitinophagaceae bacterium]|nr:GtrA family protein [Chitinophagaceae bacterium]